MSADRLTYLRQHSTSSLKKLVRMLFSLAKKKSITELLLENYTSRLSLSPTKDTRFATAALNSLNSVE